MSTVLTFFATFIPLPPPCSLPPIYSKFYDLFFLLSFSFICLYVGPFFLPQLYMCLELINQNWITSQEFTLGEKQFPSLNSINCLYSQLVVGYYSLSLLALLCQLVLPSGKSYLNNHTLEMSCVILLTFPEDPFPQRTS